MKTKLGRRVMRLFKDVDDGSLYPKMEIKRRITKSEVVGKIKLISTEDDIPWGNPTGFMMVDKKSIINTDSLKAALKSFNVPPELQMAMTSNMIIVGKGRK